MSLKYDIAAVLEHALAHSAPRGRQFYVTSTQLSRAADAVVALLVKRRLVQPEKETTNGD